MTLGLGRTSSHQLVGLFHNLKSDKGGKVDIGTAWAGLPLTRFLNTSCCTLHSLVDYIEYLAVEVGGVALLHRQVGRHRLVELRLELLAAAGEAGEQEEDCRLLHGVV